MFFDIDGTLVNEEKRLYEEIKEAVLELQSKNIFVVLATGRPPFWYEQLRKELNISSYISYNGQHVVLNHEVIYENPLHHEALLDLYEELDRRKIPTAFLDDQEMVVTQDRHPFIKQCFTKLIQDYPRIDRSFPKKRRVFQALLFTKQPLDEYFVHSYPMFHFLHWHEYSYDILPKGSSKATAMQRILEQLQLLDIEVFAFGDGANDLEMLEKADIGIAMGNALPQIKAVADYVTTTVNEKGILKALKHFELLS